jgi:hypothetical protein
VCGGRHAPRNNAGLVFTQFGVADLRGRTLNGCAARLIGIAAPPFRGELARSATMEPADTPLECYIGAHSRQLDRPRPLVDTKQTPPGRTNAIAANALGSFKHFQIP